jgi:SAM-dependent methyltransferase
MRLRLATFVAFAREHLPPAPARLLEVGCGGGEVALALAGDGYEVTGIDPRAPAGPIFRRLPLEDIEDAGGFDAVLASVSLHHLHDLRAAVDRIAGLLRPGGLLVVEEFAKEQLTGSTARWYHRQRQALGVVHGDDHHPVPDDLDAWLAEWHERHAEVHPLADVRREIDRRFAERFAAWGPYLYDHWLHDAVEPLEQALIAEGAIGATGFRYVGVSG